MRIYFQGDAVSRHDFRYAAEQMMLTLFPGQRPEYPQAMPDGEDNAVVLTLEETADGFTAAAQVMLGSRRETAACQCGKAECTGELEEYRALQRILKLAFYQAAAALLGKEPPWGALTGVRPVKLPVKAMARGLTPEQAREELIHTYRVSPARADLAMDCARASVRAKESLRGDEASLYIGIPFCPTRCAYCSFVSADVHRALRLVDPFLEALREEIALTGALLREAGYFVRTVYIGGGTPTTLSAPQLDALLAAVGESIDLSRCTEYTVEAGRPDTITWEKLAALARGGVRRVSVNPQTMEDHVLRAMGRAHTAADILRAFQLVRQAGIPCVNMDLIAGLPEDTAEGFRRSLDQILALEPENITVHTLALKKGSRLMGDGSAPAPRLPDAQAVDEMLSYAWSALGRAGQAPYYLYRQKYMSGSFENVGWSVPGWESLYNICMMEELHPILALGGGGVTKLIHPATGRIDRLANPKYPQEYLQRLERIRQDKRRAADFLAGLRRGR
ncbi:coproporphyrinogen dehydrogenase HemZ [Pseudoflavonifractor sp. 524-17]|uniref:coproporphyrinogen dehydrogenase HemZ n=1 Tax=Pseudoflavonifractor sp. 524-17 TaxID=2304577 RepID=UPI00137B8F3B|nr:coproporphyrinogen dehydrogenase HemZ [Pseudoflavonifractor sp. 524-17]NCE63620.1 coproporphyrinogen dehydrogenase HemZ [Pseudoflavonifractor sp. 524-17]